MVAILLNAKLLVFLKSWYEPAIALCLVWLLAVTKILNPITWSERELWLYQVQ